MGRNETYPPDAARIVAAALEIVRARARGEEFITGDTWAFSPAKHLVNLLEVLVSEVLPDVLPKSLEDLHAKRAEDAAREAEARRERITTLAMALGPSAERLSLARIAELVDDLGYRKAVTS